MKQRCYLKEDMKPDIQAADRGELASLMELLLLGRTPDLHMAFDLTGRVGGKKIKLRVLFNTMFGNVTIEKVSL